MNKIFANTANMAFKVVKGAVDYNDYKKKTTVFFQQLNQSCKNLNSWRFPWRQSATRRIVVNRFKCQKNSSLKKAEIWQNAQSAQITTNYLNENFASIFSKNVAKKAEQLVNVANIDSTQIQTEFKKRLLETNKRLQFLDKYTVYDIIKFYSLKKIVSSNDSEAKKAIYADFKQYIFCANLGNLTVTKYMQQRYGSFITDMLEASLLGNINSSHVVSKYLLKTVFSLLRPVGKNSNFDKNTLLTSTDDKKLIETMVTYYNNLDKLIPNSKASNVQFIDITQSKSEKQQQKIRDNITKSFAQITKRINIYSRKDDLLLNNITHGKNSNQNISSNNYLKVYKDFIQYKNKLEINSITDNPDYKKLNLALSTLKNTLEISEATIVNKNREQAVFLKKNAEIIFSINKLNCKIDNNDSEIIAINKNIINNIQDFLRKQDRLITDSETIIDSKKIKKNIETLMHEILRLHLQELLGFIKQCLSEQDEEQFTILLNELNNDIVAVDDEKKYQDLLEKFQYITNTLTTTTHSDMVELKKIVSIFISSANEDITDISKIESGCQLLFSATNLNIDDGIIKYLQLINGGVLTEEDKKKIIMVRQLNREIVRLNTYNLFNITERNQKVKTKIIKNLNQVATISKLININPVNNKIITAIQNIKNTYNEYMDDYNKSHSIQNTLNKYLTRVQQTSADGITIETYVLKNQDLVTHIQSIYNYVFSVHKINNPVEREEIKRTICEFSNLIQTVSKLLPNIELFNITEGINNEVLDVNNNDNDIILLKQNIRESLHSNMAISKIFDSIKNDTTYKLTKQQLQQLINDMQYQKLNFALLTHSLSIQTNFDLIKNKFYSLVTDISQKGSKYLLIEKNSDTFDKLKYNLEGNLKPTDEKSGLEQIMVYYDNYYAPKKLYLGKIQEHIFIKQSLCVNQAPANFKTLLNLELIFDYLKDNILQADKIILTIDEIKDKLKQFINYNQQLNSNQIFEYITSLDGKITGCSQDKLFIKDILKNMKEYVSFLSKKEPILANDKINNITDMIYSKINEYINQSRNKVTKLVNNKELNQSINITLKDYKTGDIYEHIMNSTHAFQLNEYLSYINDNELPEFLLKLKNLLWQRYSRNTIKKGQGDNIEINNEINPFSLNQSPNKVIEYKGDEEISQPDSNNTKEQRSDTIKKIRVGLGNLTKFITNIL